MARKAVKKREWESRTAVNGRQNMWSMFLVVSEN